MDGVLQGGQQRIGGRHGFEAAERQGGAGADVGVGMPKRPQQVIDEVFVYRSNCRGPPQDEIGSTTSGRSLAGLLTCRETG
jgi:hypothetical protein